MIPKMKPKLRHKARFFAIQALYDWKMDPVPAQELLERFLTLENASKNFDQEYFEKLVTSTIDHIQEIDHLMTPILDRALERVSDVELAILRLGISELKFCMDVPYRVVLNEALNLAKTFGGKNGHKYINGVLDKITQQLRKTEVELEKKSPPSV